MRPSERLEQHLKDLQRIREDLFQLHMEAELVRNKDAMLNIQLEVMHAIGKLKKFLKIPLEGEDKAALKTKST